jgi:hypothetical protein
MDGFQRTSSPPDPPIVAPPTQPMPTPPVPPPPGWVPVEARPDVRGWKKFFAIAGVVFAFPFLLTLPGWWTLSIYRQWKAGARPQPNGLIAWGMISSAMFGLLVLGVAAGTPSRLSSPPTDAYGYTQAERQGFVAGCTDSGGTDAACNCYFDELEKVYTPEEFQAEADRFDQTGGFSDTTIEALKNCL